MSKYPQHNLHTLQNRNSHYVNEKFDKSFRLLTNDCPEAAYQPNGPNDDVTTVHYGRRQLLINEIEFLCLVLESFKIQTELIQNKIVVIYAGAAQGDHILILCQLFPFIRFVLIDSENIELRYGPRNFESNCDIRKTLIDEKIANELFEEFKDNWIRLFISDIRRTNDCEDSIKDDMILQEKVHNILKPYKSYLKFRLPYFDKAKEKDQNSLFKYLDGDIYFLIWGRSHTSETRLVVHENAGTKEYDIRKHENQMFHFNRNQRTYCYDHNVTMNGFDHCYDCRAELYVLEIYMNIYDKIRSIAQEKNVRNIFDCPDNLNAFVRFLNLSIQSNYRRIDLKLNSYFNNRSCNGQYIFTDYSFEEREFTVTDYRRLISRNHKNLDDHFARMNLNN